MPVANKEPMVTKIEEIFKRVTRLREKVTEDQDSQILIENVATARTRLDELEKMIFEEYSRECFLAALNQDNDEVSQWLTVLNRLNR